MTYILQNCWEGSQLSPYQFSWHTKISTCFLQFNSSVYSDDCSDGLDLEREDQAHQKFYFLKFRYCFNCIHTWTEQRNGVELHIFIISLKWQYWAIIRSQWPNFENLVKGHLELSYATTMLKQTNLAARFCKIRSKVKFSMCSKVFNVLQIIPNKR